MATGREIQLTKQVGEYMVAAELCRRGFIATTFTGNVPDYDIVASNAAGRTLLIQVKTINGGTWQFNIQRYADVRLSGKKQVFKGFLKPPVPKLVCVFAILSADRRDRFFIFSWRTLQRILASGYRTFLKAQGGVRARRHDSFHSIVKPSQVARYENNWALIERRLR